MDDPEIDNEPPESPKPRRGPLRVVDSEGNRHRFLRGMVAYDLVHRGLGFDDAYDIARTVREAPSVSSLR